MMFTFLENALNVGIFTHAPVPNSKFQADFSENLFCPTAKRSGENYDFLYQNLIRRHEDDLKHYVIYILILYFHFDIFIFSYFSCMICNFSKCDGFSVL